MSKNDSNHGEQVAFVLFLHALYSPLIYFVLAHMQCFFLIDTEIIHLSVLYNACAMCKWHAIN